jgi:hypothetical protein
LQALLDNPTYTLDEFEELITKRNADLNAAGSLHGLTPAILAAGAGHTKELTLLIAAGAKLDTQNKYGDSAVIFAAWQGQSPALELLVKAKAKLDTQGQNDCTAGIAAASKGHTLALEILVKAGADLSLKTKRGNTALDCAIMKSHAPAISILVGKEVVGQKALEACGAPKKGGLFASSSYKADDLRTLAALKLDDKPLSEVLSHIAAKYKDDLQKAYSSYLTSGKEVDAQVAKMVETALNTQYEKTKGSPEAEMDTLHLQQNPMDHKHGASINSARLSAEDKLTVGASQANSMAAKSVKTAGQELAKDGATKAVDDKLVTSLLRGFKKPATVKGQTH